MRKLKYEEKLLGYYNAQSIKNNTIQKFNDLFNYNNWIMKNYSESDVIVEYDKKIVINESKSMKLYGVDINQIKGLAVTIIINSNNPKDISTFLISKDLIILLQHKNNYFVIDNFKGKQKCLKINDQNAKTGQSLLTVYINLETLEMTSNVSYECNNSTIDLDLSSIECDHINIGATDLRFKNCDIEVHNLSLFSENLTDEEIDELITLQNRIIDLETPLGLIKSEADDGSSEYYTLNDKAMPSIMLDDIVGYMDLGPIESEFDFIKYGFNNNNLKTVFDDIETFKYPLYRCHSYENDSIHRMYFTVELSSIEAVGIEQSNFDSRYSNLNFDDFEYRFILHQKRKYYTIKDSTLTNIPRNYIQSKNDKYDDASISRFEPRDREDLQLTQLNSTIFKEKGYTDTKDLKNTLRAIKDQTDFSLYVWSKRKEASPCIVYKNSENYTQYDDMIKGKLTFYRLY